MATVTAYTAAKMDEIANICIIDGAISGDNLILEQRDGTTINTGSVRGPAGPTGPSAEAVECMVSLSAGTVTIPTNATPFRCPFDVYARLGSFNGGSGVKYWVAPDAGIVEVYASIILGVTGGTTNNFYASITNDALEVARIGQVSGAIGLFTAAGSMPVEVAAGDHIAAEGYIDSTGTSRRFYGTSCMAIRYLER